MTVLPALTLLPLATGRPTNHWVIAFTVTLATFMEVLDTSIANVALPHMAGSLAASQDESTWVLTSYLVSNAVVLPLSGWLSRRFGRKRFYMTCVLLFTISSALCGLAPSLGWLVFFRVLQGVGGGGLQPSEQAILMDTFPPAKRGMAMAVYGMAILVAPILGPTLGGWITDNYSWRWIFLINVPVGLFSLFLSNIVLEDPPHLKAERQASKGQRVDFIGLGLIAVGLAALEIIYDKGEAEGWFGSHFIIILAVTAAFSLVTAVIWEMRHPDPIVNLRLFGDRNFAACCAVMFFVFGCMYGSTVLLPQLLQTLMGYSATYAGYVLSPAGFVTMAIMPVVGFLLSKRIDARILIAIGLLTTALAMHLMAGLTTQASPNTFIHLRMVQTLGMGFLWVPASTAAYLYIDKTQTNNASGLFNLVRNEGASFGVAFVTTMLARRTQFHLSRLGENLHALNTRANDWLQQLTNQNLAVTGDPVLADQMAWASLYRLVQREALTMSYLDLFRVFTIVAIAVIPLLLFMRKSVATGGTAVH